MLVFETTIGELKEGATIPPGFTAVTVQLDGKVDASLCWKEEEELAKRYVDQGFSIVFELDLGLFKRLKAPLEDKGQYLALELAIEYFRNTLWPKFSHVSQGLILYRGSLDFADDRDRALDYLELLVRAVPEGLPLLLLLDCSAITDSLQALLNLHPERFHSFTLCLKNAPLLTDSYVWERGRGTGFIGRDIEAFHQVLSPTPSLGLLLPSLHTLQEQNLLTLPPVFRTHVEALQKTGRPYRLISEEHLTTKWHGLNELIVVPECVSSQGKRKIQGFMAAGGEVIS